MADALKLNDPDQFGTQQTSAGVVDVLTPVALLWMRDVPIATSSLVSADTTKKVLTFDPDSSSIPREGEWVTLSTTTGEATLISAQGAYGYLVVAGRGRLDIPAAEGITVVMGGYIAEVSRYNTSSLTGSTLFGAALTTTAAGILEAASSADRVVAFFEQLVARNGTTYVRINTHGAGGIF